MLDSIRAKCPNCKNRITVSRAAAGKRIRCPHCEASLSVPGAAAPIAARPIAPPVPIVPVAQIAPPPPPPPKQKRPRLEECPDCGREVSPSAQECPGCGCPFQTLKFDEPARREAPITKVYVDRPQGSNSFGVASLVVGVLAVVLCWVPGLGLVLGGLGLLLALAGGFTRNGAGYAIAGFFVSLLSFAPQAITILGLTAMIGSLDMPKKIAPVVKDTPKAEKPVPEPEVKAKLKAADEVATIGQTLVANDVSVTLNQPVIDFVQVKAIGGGSNSTKKRFLQIPISVENRSRTKLLEFSGWGDTDRVFGDPAATLKDEFGNVYRQVGGFSRQVIGQTIYADVHPGKTVVDLLIFDLPIEAATVLQLELDGSNIRTNSKLRFRIPTDRIEKRFAGIRERRKDE